MRMDTSDTVGGLRMIAGRVSSAGAIESGSGFTITKAGTGAYTIRFTPAFRSTPGVVATARAAAVGQTEIAVDTESADSVRLVTDGGATDNAFAFVAVGLA